MNILHVYMTPSTHPSSSGTTPSFEANRSSWAALAIGASSRSDEPDGLTMAIRQALFDRSLTLGLLPVRLLGVGTTRLTREALAQGTCSMADFAAAASHRRND